MVGSTGDPARPMAETIENRDASARGMKVTVVVVVTGSRGSLDYTAATRSCSERDDAERLLFPRASFGPNGVARREEIKSPSGRPRGKVEHACASPSSGTHVRKQKCPRRVRGRITSGAVPRQDVYRGRGQRATPSPPSSGNAREAPPPGKDTYGPE
ncbi:hypothetical protein MTO96_014864 [Rhipicephalus appendiculatus]